ncbi:MAG: phage tail tape measure protein [Clostridia bacterium]|nr:phage tail tape measure protein [Clostridia bacterium]
MAGRKEYEMLFQLNAQMGSSYSTTFSKAQQQLVSMQKEIQALTKTQSDISAFQKQQGAVEATRSKLAVLQQQYDNIQKEIKETEGYSSSLENKLLAKQQQIDRTSSSLQQQTDKLKQMDAALRDAGVDTNNLSNASSNLTAKIEDLKAKQEEAANGAKSFGEQSSEAFGAIQQAIAAAGVATALKEIYDAYMECVNIAADFEETMSTVEALSGASAGEMEELTALAKELGATTKFTAKESAEAMTYMGMAGWSASQMMAGMEGVLQLAAASGEDLALVSDIVTDNLTAFGLAASDTARFSDVLAAAATNSNTSVSVMGETFKMSASIAGALGYSVEDVAVAVGLMANSGIKGSIAGTALKNTFNGLLEGCTLTSEAFGEYEYTAVKADGTMKDFSSTIDELRGYFEQMTEAERVNNAMTIAGQRGYNGLLAILNATDEEYSKLTKNINECSGAAGKMAAIKLDNLNGELTLMNSAWDALKTTIGEQFNPELRQLYSAGTDLFGLLDKFVQQNPGLVKGITAFVAVLGAAVAGLAAYAAITKVVIPLMHLFTASIPGVNIIMGVATAIAALTGIMVGLSTETKNEAQQIRELTTSSREQYKEIQSLEKEYKDLCDAGKETSEEAYYLQYRIESLTESFEAQKQTLEEYISTSKELNEAWNDSLDSNREAVEEIETNEGRTLALISRLSELASQTDKTAASQEEMKAIIAELNEILPNVAFSYEDIKDGLGEIEQLLKNEATAQANLAKAEQARKSMMNADAERVKAQKHLDDLNKQYAAEQEINKTLKERRDSLQESSTFWVGSGGRGTNPYAESLKEAKADYKASTEALESYKTQIEETTSTINQATADYNSYLKTIVETSGITVENIDTMNALDEVVASASLSMQALANSYAIAYTAAKESFEGQYGLFDQAQADMEATVGSAQRALDSQLNFWQTYADNVNVLRSVSAEDLGVTQENYNEIMAYAQSGSEEAAGFAASLAQAVNSGNTEAITKLANTVGEVKAAREKAAGEVSAWQVDFDGQMKEIISIMETSLQDMDMSEEAIAAAKSTMDSYAETISTQGATAVANALSIANQIRTALQSASTNINIGVTGGKTGNGYAMGTDSATPGWHLVGENGPEIVYFGGGETVYNASETAKLLSNAQEEMQIVSFLPLMHTYYEATRRYNAMQYAEPLVAKSGHSGNYQISIAPQLIVEGGTTEDIESRFQEFSDIVVGNVMDALEEAGIDAKRGAYV